MNNESTQANFYIKEVCLHPNKITEVISCFCNCETTEEVCLDCFEVVTEAKTECR